MKTIMKTLLILCGLFAGALAFAEVLEVETRDELGSMRDQLKSCFGISQWVWMTKMNSRGDIENCIKSVTGTSNPGPYLSCIGLKTGWYKGKTGVFRSSGDNLLGCIVQSETWCPVRGKREVDEDEEEEEELVDIEARGLMGTSQVDDLNDCLGVIANKFMTAITNRQGFADCVKSICPSYSDGVINGAASCIGFAEGMGPGPKCKWMDFFTKKKMGIMNNRGRLGKCMRQQGQKCQ